MYSIFFKPLLDKLIAFTGLLLASPLLLLILLVLFIFQKGNVFFIQARPGKKGKIFQLIKFKTMNNNKDGNGNLLSDEERLTGVGKFIRKTSLDELPQLINVLKGEMSLIGPRPLLIEYLPLYSKEQARRHDVKPGITGWAQINGRNTVGWQKRFEYDIYYVDNKSLWFDLKILFITIYKIFKAEGISSNTSITMENFTINTKR